MDLLLSFCCCFDVESAEIQASQILNLFFELIYLSREDALDLTVALALLIEKSPPPRDDCRIIRPHGFAALCAVA